MTHFDRFLAQLGRHEGCSLVPYRCSAGHWTIGKGHKLLTSDVQGLRINMEIADALLDADARDAWRTAYDLTRGVQGMDDDKGTVRVYALANMAFNLGAGGLGEFKRMWAAIQRGDWAEAAREALDSTWATQVGDRARELAEQIRTGEWQR